ncbi:MAG: hypothetical protein AB4426_17195 [Xenococcaceae cyanobacterium]
MFPWLQWWAPNYHFPFSGAVNQNIAPETDWFLGNINSEVGDPEIEEEVFHKVASYGKQIGIITDVLLALVNEIEPEAMKEVRALEQLKELQEKVEKIKVEKKKLLRNNARRILDKLAQSDPEFLEELLKSYPSDRSTTRA